MSARALGLGKLSRGEQAELLSALGRAGLEHTGKAIRVPLAEQVQECLARAGAQGLHESALAREVKGARSAAELQLALQELFEEGTVLKLVDESGVRLATRAARVLTGAELDQLAALAKRLGVLAKATRAGSAGPRPTLARMALEAPCALLQQLAGAREPTQGEARISGSEPTQGEARTSARQQMIEARSAAREAHERAAAREHGAGNAIPEPVCAPEPSEPEAPGDVVRQALLAAFLAAPSPSGLIRVPDVIRALERLFPRAALLAAAGALARRGELELRPEASIGRLARDERVRCPAAPDGTPLSCARLLSPEGARP